MSQPTPSVPPPEPTLVGAADLAQQFRALCCGPGPAPDVRQFLAQAGSVSPQQLAAVLCVDLRQRWQCGEAVRVERYLTDFPILGQHPDSFLDLVYTELLLQEEKGPSPNLEDYRHRFPALFDRLKQQVEFGRVLQRESEHGGDELVATRRLGDFEIVRQLGRGGMGIVYEARQLSLNRKVALKVLPFSLGGTARVLARFKREAEAAARLHHTHIVPVYAIGEEDGFYFYAMELIEGPSLDRVLAQMREQALPSRQDSTSSEKSQPPGTLPNHAEAAVPALSAGTTSSLGSGSHYFDQVARLIADVADALDHAHKQGVLHRDIKPSNLLLSPDGRLSITDFGLARLLEQPGITVPGEFAGTPAYVSPEQAMAGPIPIDHRTDVYSLGATLYELLTLRPPFLSESRDQLLAQVLTKEPLPPRRLNKAVPRDLETICLKALEKDPDQRYQTAAALADDLRRYVNRFAIAARRAGPVARMVKWARRHPGVSAALAAVLLAVGLAGYFAYQTHAARQQALAEKRQNTLDNAMLHAMSGNFEQADRAVAEAEQVGASPAEVSLRRGIVAFYRAQGDQATQHLEKALEARPNWVAAQGMLALAYGYQGRGEEMTRIQKRLEQLPALTADDYLFRGYSQGLLNPEASLDDLNRALASRPSLIGYLIRAEVRSWRADDTGELVHAELALKDVERARALLETNPVVLWVSAFTHLVAANIHARDGRKDREQQCLEQARKDVEALLPYNEHPIAASNRWRYYTQIGRQAELLDELRTSSEKTCHPSLILDYARTLYGLGRFQEAKQRLEHPATRTLPGAFMVLRALLRAECGEWEEALQLWETQAKDNPAAYPVPILLLLGKPAQARECARTLRRNAQSGPPHLRDWYETLYRFSSGEIGEAELLDSAGKSRWKTAEAHLLLGMWELSQGNRKKAREHFQKGKEVREMARNASDWCGMLSRRMEEDPTGIWPPWIPSR